MAKRKIIISVRGKHGGGYYLGKTLNDISVGEITSCIDRNKIKEDVRQVLDSEIILINFFKSCEDVLYAIKLSSFFAPKTNVLKVFPTQEGKGNCSKCFYSLKKNVDTVRHTCRKCADGSRWKVIKK